MCMLDWPHGPLKCFVTGIFQMFVKSSAPNKPQIVFFKLIFSNNTSKSLADNCLVNMTISRSRNIDLP